jgi:hypothetical protein
MLASETISIFNLARTSESLLNNDNSVLMNATPSNIGRDSKTISLICSPFFAICLINPAKDWRIVPEEERVKMLVDAAVPSSEFSLFLPYSINMMKWLARAPRLCCLSCS